MLILNNCLFKHVYIIVITSYIIKCFHKCRVIIDVDDKPIITAFNYLYCLSTDSTQMKNTFFIGLVGPGGCCSHCFMALIGVNTNCEIIVRIRCVYRKKEFVEFGLMVIIRLK